MKCVARIFVDRSKSILLLSCLCFGVVAWAPIHNAWAICFCLISLGLMIIPLGVLFKRWRLSLTLFLLVLSPFCLPNKEIDPTMLRRSYLKELRSFEGVKYVWGGEASSGIDCSGLPRRAYRNALINEGLRTFNGRLTRLYLEQWFYDSSAKALSESYRSFTRPIHYTTTAQNSLDDKIEPGDLAITSGGIHVMIYLGEDYWIQSDPVEGRVIIKHKLEEKAWFDDEVSLYRWSEL